MKLISSSLPSIQLYNDAHPLCFNYLYFYPLEVALCEMEKSADLPKDLAKASHISFQLSATGLDDMDVIGTSDPFVVISRLNNRDNNNNNNNNNNTTKNNNNKIELYRTEVIDESVNPQWDPFCLSLDIITGIDSNSANITADDLNSILLFECYDEDPTSNELIGNFQVHDDIIYPSLFSPILFYHFI